MCIRDSYWHNPFDAETLWRRYEALVLRARACGDSFGLFRAITGCVTAACFLKDLDSANADSQRLLDLAAERPELRSMAHLFAYYACAGAGRCREGLEHIETAIENLDVAITGYPVGKDLTLTLRLNRVWATAVAGDDAAWASVSREYRKLGPDDAAARGDVLDLGIAALAALWRGDDEAAALWAELCRDRAVLLGRDELVDQYETILTVTRCRRGEHGADALVEPVRRWDEHGSAWGRTLFLLEIADTYRREGHEDGAWEALERAWTPPVEAEYEAECWRALGDLLGAFPDRRKSARALGVLPRRPSRRECYEKAISIATDLGIVVTERRARAGLDDTVAPKLVSDAS